MKKHVTWILVADGKRGMVFSHDGPGHGIVAIPGMTFETELHPSRDIVSDKPGRVQESAYSGRHAVEPLDYHRIEKTQFAQELAKRLDAAIEQGKCQSLVLVAPPRALGDLRQALAPKSRSAITGEIDKDLTQSKLPDIAKHLETVLAV